MQNVHYLVVGGDALPNLKFSFFLTQDHLPQKGDTVTLRGQEKIPEPDMERPEFLACTVSEVRWDFHDVSMTHMETPHAHVCLVVN